MLGGFNRWTEVVRTNNILRRCGGELWALVHSTWHTLKKHWISPHIQKGEMLHQERLCLETSLHVTYNFQSLCRALLPRYNSSSSLKSALFSATAAPTQTPANCVCSCRFPEPLDKFKTFFQHNHLFVLLDEQTRFVLKPFHFWNSGSQTLPSQVSLLFLVNFTSVNEKCKTSLILGVAINSLEKGSCVIEVSLPRRRQPSLLHTLA